MKLSFISLFLFLLLDSSACAQNKEYIFDWVYRFGPAADDPPVHTPHTPGYPSAISPIPQLGFRAINHSFRDRTLAESHNTGLRTGIMVKTPNRPLDTAACPATERDPKFLEYVLDNLNTPLDFVFTDIEGLGPDCNDENLKEVINLVRNNSNPNVSQARVAAYPEYPGADDISNIWEHKEDRSVRSEFYFTSGLDVAMPACYHLSPYSVHARAASQKAPNVRWAIFWGPIHKMTVAKDALPAGHLLIPWVDGFEDVNGYAMAAPTKADLLASQKHFRMRGADGYYRLYVTGVRSDFFQGVDSWIKKYDNKDHAHDLYNSWSELDKYFGLQPTSKFHSRAIPTDKYSEKRSGILFSGVRYVNDVELLVSNLGNNDQSVSFPDLYDLPTESPSIAAPPPHSGNEDPPLADSPTSPSHRTICHKIVNLIENGDFENGDSGWQRMSTSKVVPEGGVGGSKGMELGHESALVSNTPVTRPDVEPSARMKLIVTARGRNAKLDAAFRYTDTNDGQSRVFSVEWEGGNQQTIQSTNPKVYVSQFTTPAFCGRDIEPIFYHLKVDAAQESELVIDDIVIKFDDSNLLRNGDFDYSGTETWQQSFDWTLSHGSSLVENRRCLRNTSRQVRPNRKQPCNEWSARCSHAHYWNFV